MEIPSLSQYFMADSPETCFPLQCPKTAARDESPAISASCWKVKPCSTRYDSMGLGVVVFMEVCSHNRTKNATCSEHIVLVQNMEGLYMISMNKYEEIAQEAWQAILKKIKELHDNGETYEKIASRLGINRSRMSDWKNGNGEAVNTSMSNMLGYLDALGLSIYDFIPAPTMKKFGAHSTETEVRGENLMTVPILGEAGAGNPADFFSSAIESGGFLQVLPTFYQEGMAAVRVAGDSMEPLIKKGAYVGVVPFDGSLAEGGIYLVNRPPFGLLVKRVRMDKQGQIVLFSENSEYEPQVVPYEGYDQIIIGQVVWGWQAY